MLDTANSVNRDRELIIDEICDELRKGVSHAHDKMIKAHMQGKIEATSADQFGSPLIVSASQGGMKDVRLPSNLFRMVKMNRRSSICWQGTPTSTRRMEMGAQPCIMLSSSTDIR
mmetsp:Transcript_29999/g.96198  ORF Transcript_29999/g.96198 Transcript_29999/m.96198 type:complete len:115 (+) Transcript_29999:288-632(+)